MEQVQCQGGTRWSSVAPRIAFEKNVMVAVSKLVADLGVGDPEKVTTEGVDHVSCKVAICTKKPKNLALNVEVASLRHLVRVFPARTPEHRELCSQSRQNIVGPELLAGGFLETENSRTSRRNWTVATGRFVISIQR